MSWGFVFFKNPRSITYNKIKYRNALTSYIIKVNHYFWILVSITINNLLDSKFKIEERLKQTGIIQMQP